MKESLSKGAANPYNVEAKWPEAPYGDVMPDVVPNYLRAAPHVGTGGLPKDGSFAALKDLGFKTIINLNTKDEGAETEEKAATAAGLEYVSIEVPTKAPTAEQVAELAKIVEDPEMYPVLLHCHSANRVGAMWALYRASTGVPAEIAIQEGRTVGLKPSREGAVREQLGLPSEG
jgi:uncharacterized protein (TIGR01244 family)